MSYIRFAILCASVIACSREPDRRKSEPDPTPRLEELKLAYESKFQNMAITRDAETGWPSRHDCDAMIWAGKYAASRAVSGVNIEAAEYPDQPGKFGRRPPPYCWNATDGDVGSKTEWSRDMFIAGLLPYIWRTGRRDILERHLAYGKENNWKMGEPLADGRTIYTPSIIGLAYTVQQAMGGETSASASWPSVYPSGLTDYEAHLQAMAIWVSGEAAAAIGDADAIPRDPDSPSSDGDVGKTEPGAALVQVSGTMFKRLEEHATREPACPTFQVIYALYSGTMAKAIDSLLGDVNCQYLRCGDGQCYTADWLFAASLALDHIDKY